MPPAAPAAVLQPKVPEFKAANDAPELAILCAHAGGSAVAQLQRSVSCVARLGPPAASEARTRRDRRPTSVLSVKIESLNCGCRRQRRRRAPAACRSSGRCVTAGRPQHGRKRWCAPFGSVLRVRYTAKHRKSSHLRVLSFFSSHLASHDRSAFAENLQHTRSSQPSTTPRPVADAHQT
jgi:hypothetical protein